MVFNRLLRTLPHIFHEPYSSHSACYPGLCYPDFLQIDAIVLRRCCLMSKRKELTFGTFGKINKLQGK